jgi:tripartite-type tricarboxylate transporter receptor subunit TctC
MTTTLNPGRLLRAALALGIALGAGLAAEAGLPGFSAYVWVGAMVHGKTPKAETDRLAGLLAQIERLPETREFYEKQGAEVMQGGADEMRSFQAAEIALWKRVAVKAKIELQD